MLWETVKSLIKVRVVCHSYAIQKSSCCIREGNLVGRRRFTPAKSTQAVSSHHRFHVPGNVLQEDLPNGFTQGPRRGWLVWSSVIDLLVFFERCVQHLPFFGRKGPFASPLLRDCHVAWSLLAVDFGIQLSASLNSYFRLSENTWKRKNILSLFVLQFKILQISFSYGFFPPSYAVPHRKWSLQLLWMISNTVKAFSIIMRFMVCLGI